jgi:SanA protein
MTIGIPLFTLILLLIIFIIAAHATVAGKYYNNIIDFTRVPAHDVVVVLGASVWSNARPSNILEDRLLTGIELYKKGLTKKMLMSGDHGQENYDEVNTMRTYAQRMGVAEDDIFMDHAGFRTYDSLYRAREVFGLHNCIIVTNNFHLPRALYIARELGIDAIGVKSDLRVYQDQALNDVREFFARIKAFLDVNIIKPKPKYLGEKIDINGSGMVTRD